MTNENIRENEEKRFNEIYKNFIKINPNEEGFEVHKVRSFQTGKVKRTEKVLKTDINKKRKFHLFLHALKLTIEAEDDSKTINLCCEGFKKYHKENKEILRKFEVLKEVLKTK